MLNVAPLLLAFVLAAPATLEASDAKPLKAALSRVRAADERAAALLSRGLERSQTLRRIVDELETRDVIVYLQMEPAMDRHLAGGVTWVIATSTVRYVRVSLNQYLVTDARIVALGHELQHVLEIARQPSIVDSKTLAAYYGTHGFSNPGYGKGWDTQAARDTGNEIRRELAGITVSRVTVPTQDFDASPSPSAYGEREGHLSSSHSQELQPRQTRGSTRATARDALSVRH